MLRLLIVALVLLAGSAPALADQSSPPRTVDYRIDVRLDVVKKELTGSEHVVWTNPSTDTVTDLWFHLYLNAFRSDRTTFFKESGGQLRGDYMPEDGWGWTDLKSIRLADGMDLLPVARFEQPDDGNGEDRTVLRVPLPQPVPAGGSIAIDIAWHAKLPKVFARTGYARDFFLVGQWFPKLAVYEPAGVRGRKVGGWNCHQFHANSEFYADFGRFDVRMTVPSTFIVGATGERVGADAHPNGTTTYHYVQDGVHDFGWTADPRFVEVTDTFSAARDVTQDEYRHTAVTLGRSVDSLRLSDISIRLLMQPGRTPQIARYLAAAKLAIKWFGLWYGPYPYRTLTIVDPPSDAPGAEGMEYPTFITGGTMPLLNWWPLSHVREPEEVIVHEYAHQYWYGLVASNEFEEPWLDEGFTSYSTGQAMELAFGTASTLIDLPFFKVSERDLLRLTNSPEHRFDRVRQPAWTYSPGEYPFYAYEKPELVLRTLEHMIGRQAMARVMRTYQERWRYRHPSSDDFYTVASEVSNRDLRGYFSQVVDAPGIVDYDVSSLTSHPIGRASAGTVGRTAPDGGEAVTAWRSKVVITRRGDVILPVQLLLTYADGKRERVTWDGRDRWTAITREGPSPIASAVLDPDDALPLDANVLNNGRRKSPDVRVASSWAARWLFWVQHVIAGAGL